MPTHHRIIYLGVAFLSAVGQAAVHAAPVVIASEGGFQGVTAGSGTYGRDEVGVPSIFDDARVSSSPSAELSHAAPGNGNVKTGVIGTYPYGTTGATPLPGVSASVDIAGTRLFEGLAPLDWSAHAAAVASAQTGRMELATRGLPFSQGAAGGEFLFALSSATGTISNYFQPLFSREVAAALQTTPQYLTLTATLAGTTTQPGQVKGSLRIVSDYLTMGGLQELAIDVNATGEWTQQYTLQYAFTNLLDYGGHGNCLQRPDDAWVQCLSGAAVEANFSLLSDFGSGALSDLSVLLSWSVPDTVLSLRTDAASWGAPLAVDPPQGVPEPASGAMVLLALGALAGVQRLRPSDGAGRREATTAS
jgi:hypothetical protein